MDLDTLKEEVRARSDIIDVLGSYVKFVRAGTTHKACCPFHDEKTPSFNVDQRKQMYHCFGCGESGDVFKFIMEFEKVDFMTALERLANRCGIPFEFDSQKRDSGPKKDRLFDMHQKWCAYMVDYLHNAPAAGPARQYLKERSMTGETFDAFHVGFAPDQFDEALNWARKQKFTEEEIEASGLFSERENPGSKGRFFDRFRGRIMFPIHDELGRVIGFSGRVLRKEQSPAKYMNSPETKLFKKSRVLFAIDKARQQIATMRQAILCEGQVDVIRCHSVGLTQAVAAQGTAITEEHAKILRRYADEVILLLDADAAGVKAALRSSESLLKEGISIRVAQLPEGEDPDSIVISRGENALIKVVESAVPFLHFQVDTLLSQEGAAPGEAARLRVARAVMETIQHAGSAIQRQGLLEQASERLGIRVEALEADLKTSAAPRTQPGANASTVARPPKNQPSPPRAPGKPKMPDAERFLFELLCNEPELISEVRDYLKPEQLDHPKSQKFFEFLLSLDVRTSEGLQDAAREHPMNKMVNYLLINHRELQSEEQTPQTAVRDLLLLLRKKHLERRLEDLQHKMRDVSGDEAESLIAESWQLRIVANRLQEAVRSREWEIAAPILKVYE